MRILITGATGFIGSHLVERLAGQHQLFALARRPPTKPKGLVHYIQQDLRQPLDLDQLPQRLDVIIHQAAVIHTELCQDDTEPFVVNVAATWRLLEYAHKAGIQTFVYASTGGIYGCRDQPFTEEDLPQPMDLYALTKAQAELAVQTAPGKFHKILLRYFFPYGIGTPNPIPHFVRRAVQGQPIEILGSGKPALNPLHISDAVEATVRALELNSDAVINIAGSEVTTFAQIAEIAARRVGREPQLVVVPDEAAIPYYRADLVADTSRMQKLLAFKPQVKLETGIAELADYYQNES